MPDRVISVPQATQIATKIKNKFDTVNGRLGKLNENITSITGNSVIEFSSGHNYINLSGSSVDMVEGVPQYSSGSTSYYCARIPCSAGDKFTINGTGGTTTRLWGFVSSTGEVLLVAKANVSETNLVITAPENASWLIVHRRDNSQSYSGVLTRNLVDSFAKKSDALLKQRSLNLFDESAKTVGLLNSSGTVGTGYTDYDTTDFIPVTSGHTLCFQNDNFTNPVTYYCFYDINKSLLGSRGSFNPVGFYGTISVPNNASYVRVSYKNGSFKNVMITDGSNPVPYLPYLYSLDVQKCNIGKCYVDLRNESINVVSKYGTNTDFVVSFGKRGPNNLPDFKSFASASDTEEFVSDVIPTASVIMTTGTDWLGPYIVKAVDNINGDLPNSNDFTGGNHNYNNTGSGDYSATARCSSLRYFVNGKEVSTFYGYADNVEVRWINYVQATNTKKVDGTGREVIKEKHSAIFDGIKWTITVDIEMLEDVQIATYYGFQMSGVSSIYPNFRFVNGMNKAWYTNSEAHSSGNKNPDAIIAMGTSHMIQITLYPYGLGNRDYYDGTSGAFCMENGNKCYFNLIKDSTFLRGEVVSAKASYQFSPV